MPGNVARWSRRAQCKAGAIFPPCPDRDLDLLAILERDMSLESATHFTALAAQYLADTRDRESTVSTGRSSDEIAERFDEPIPLDAQPLETVVSRLRVDVLPDVQPPLSSALRRPSGLAAAARGDLDGAIDRRAQSVARGGGDVAGRDGARASRRAMDVRARRLRRIGGRHAHERWHRGDVHRAPRCARHRDSPTRGRMASARTRPSSSAASTRTTPSRAPWVSSAWGCTTPSSFRRGTGGWTPRRSR